MDSINRISLFLEVVKHQSFIKAARAVGMTGSAVTKQIQSLEDELGVRLLQRTTRQVTLTEAGALYSQKVRKAMDEIEEAKSEIQDLKLHPKGILKINAPVSFGHAYLASPLVNFACQYPDLHMEVDFDDRHIDMIAEGYDIVIRIGVLADSSLIVRPLANCPIVICASPQCLERHGRPVDINALTDYPTILYNRHGHNPYWRYKRKDGTQQSTIQLKPVFSANNSEMMREACLQGLGVCVLPIFAVYSDLQSGRLISLFPEYEIDPARHIFALYPQKRYLSSKVRLLTDYLANICKKFPW